MIFVFFEIFFRDGMHVKKTDGKENYFELDN